MIKPRVLLVTHPLNIAFQIKAGQIKSLLSDEFKIDIRSFTNLTPCEYDVMVSLWWRYLSVGELDLVTAKFGTVCAVYDAWSWSGQPRGGGLIGMAMDRSDVLVVANDVILNGLRAQLGQLPPTVICEDAIDTTKFTPRWRDGEIQYPDEFTALWVGNSKASAQTDNDLKGTRIVAEACRLAGVPLLVADVGKKPIPYEDMPEFYHRGTALLIASTAEGGPRPLLEALATGRPVIGTRVGLVPKAVQHGISGCIVGRDIRAFMHGLGYIREQMNDHPTAIGSACRRTAEAHDMRYKIQSWRVAIHAALENKIWKNKLRSGPVKKNSK